MEIADYLAIARRRLAVLVLVPLLAGALAAAYLFLAPPRYVATAYVSAPSSLGEQTATYAGPNGADQFVQDFTATATSPAVADAVARKTGVDAGNVTDDVSVQQVDLSSRLELTYTTTRPDRAKAVVAAVASETLKSMFAPQVSLARARVDAATASLHHANQALADFSKRHGSLPIDQRYAALTQQITQLKEQKAIDESQGITWSASALQSTISAKEAELAKLSAHVAKYQDLVATQQAAVDGLTTANQNLAQAQAQLSAAAPGQVVQASDPTQVPTSTLVLTRVLPAVGAGLFLAIALVAALELLARHEPARASSPAPAREDAVDNRRETRHLPAEGPA